MPLVLKKSEKKQSTPEKNHRDASIYFFLLKIIVNILSRTRLTEKKSRKTLNIFNDLIHSTNNMIGFREILFT
jgi:hypothetical protein